MGTVVFGVTPRTDTATKTGRCNYSSPAPRERPPLLWVITRGRRRGVRRGCSKRSHFFLSPAILMENYRVLWVFFSISSRRTETKSCEDLSRGFTWLCVSEDTAGNLSTNLTKKLLLPTTYSLVLVCVCVSKAWYTVLLYQCATLLHCVTGSFMSMNVGTGVYFESITRCLHCLLAMNSPHSSTRCVLIHRWK